MSSNKYRQRSLCCHRPDKAERDGNALNLSMTGVEWFLNSGLAYYPFDEFIINIILIRISNPLLLFSLISARL